jgi:hypothetical protein
MHAAAACIFGTNALKIPPTRKHGRDFFLIKNAID